MAGKLRVIAGPDTGGVFELPASGTVVLGRDKGTLTQFRERTVSRSHCRLEVVGDRVLVINDSQSGTLVNDRPITRSELRPNDVIRLGEESETRIRFEVEDVHSEATIRGGSVGKILQEEFNALVGKTLGHFQIARLLGSDALGTTFRAWDNRHKRQVALKVFVPEPNLPQRFRMFQPVLGLQHPGLVALWEAGDTDARYWCSLEDVEGETLETLLGSSSRKAGGTGPIPWDQVLRFAIQLTEGLAALHRKNLVHRGITPGAVLLTTSGKEARLSGLWNVRTITDCKTDTADTQDVLRDVAYMPPERAGFGKPATMRGDLYSLGAVLYHMLTGQPPFAGGGDKEIIANIVRNAPAALRTFQPSLPDPLEQAVMSLLAKRPDDRYQNVLDLLTTLRGSALGRPAAGVAGGGVAGDGWRVAGKEKAAGLSVPLPATRHPPPASPPVPPAQAPAAAAKPSDRISFACPCGMTMQTRRQFAGERVRCPWCKTFLIVPGGPARVAPPSQKPVAEELPPEPEAGEEAQHPSVAVPQAPSDLRRSALRGALWIGISVIASNVLKLVTKMIMTRLVLPESYGVLDMAMVFVQGVHMFADVGIGTSIIQSKRGDERDFLDTAWTLQILRGLVLWAIIAAIAWPVSVFFGQPELLLVIPVAGVTAIIDGCNSTVVFTLQRHLVRAPLVLLEFCMTVFGQLVTIAWMVLIAPSLWGFVVGMLSTSLLNMILTHLLLSRERNRFRWDREAVHEMLHFGKWIFLSTMITFLALQAERIIIPKVGGARLNGIYSQALALASIAIGLMSSFAAQLILPIYSRLHLAGEDIRQSFNKVHGSASVVAALLVSGMIAAGPAAVKCQFGDQYQDAGWMLQFVAVGAWFQMLEGTLGATLLTLGQSRSLTVVNASRLVGVLLFVPAGYYLGRWFDPGEQVGTLPYGSFLGMLVGFIAADFLRYLVVVWTARKNGMSALGSDIMMSLLIAIISPAAAVAGWWLAKPFEPHLVAKGHAAIVFFAQGILVVVAWGLVYLLWVRKAHGLREAMAEAEGLPEAPGRTIVSYRHIPEA